MGIRTFGLASVLPVSFILAFTLAETLICPFASGFDIELSWTPAVLSNAPPSSINQPAPKFNYVVYGYPVQGGKGFTNSVGNVTNTILPNLTPKTTYVFYVKAHLNTDTNTNDLSRPSKTLTYTVPAFVDETNAIFRAAGQVLRITNGFKSTIYAEGGTSPVKITSVTSPSARGIPVQLKNGVLVYNPPKAFTGSDEIIFMISNAAGIWKEHITVSMTASHPKLGIGKSGTQVSFTLTDGTWNASYPLLGSKVLTRPIWKELGTIPVGPDGTGKISIDETNSAESWFATGHP